MWATGRRELRRRRVRTMLRKVLRFKGGVHPPERKLGTDVPIERIPEPMRVFVPLSQHTGAPAKPTVEVGDYVLAGQLIGEAQGRISANVHASISGTVKSIAERPHPALRDVVAIEIETDHKDEWVELAPADPDELSPEEIVDRVYRAGIVGLGGAAFPTHVKLAPPPNKPIEIVIVNGSECEPILTADDRLMQEHADEIVAGARLVARAVGAKSLIIAVEDNKKTAIARMRDAASRYDIPVVALRTRYPQGAEKQLIFALTGRQVPSGGLPMDVGALVHNVGTCYAIWRAVAEGRPLTERVVTVVFKDKVKNFWVPIGTLARDVLTFAGIGLEGIKKLVFGGPMMGVAQYTAEVPVVKGTSGIVAFSEDELALDRRETSCIRCGRCV
ncbi:MAG TPA: electron transport complex subunit RsxC, partial [Proteobacteria bacterium]|nr:electron transport complex subunit RsxC [Pseudomonadota bacterium]